MPNKPDMFADPDGYTEWVIQAAANKMAADADRQQGIAEGRINDMVADTEAEVFWDSFPDSKAAPHAYANRNGETGDDLINEMSRMEGIDGEPLSDEEQMATAMQGHDAIDGYIGDRPLQHQHELDVDQENRVLRDQLAQSERARQETINRYDPQRQDEHELSRAQFLDQHGLFAMANAKADALFAGVTALQQSNQQLQNQRGNESLNEAHAKYGHDFEAAYTSLQQANPRSPLTQALYDHVRNSPDPGEAIMQLHGNDLVASLGVGRYVEPPFARTREIPRGPVRVDRVSRNEDDFDSGYGHQQVEEDVFNSAMKDKPTRGYVNRGRGWQPE
jgi:hypothetical protein